MGEGVGLRGGREGGHQEASRKQEERLKSEIKDCRSKLTLITGTTSPIPPLSSSFFFFSFFVPFFLSLSLSA
eukprot:1480335-Rhodomonas_salina.1